MHRRGSKVRYSFTLSAERLFVNLKTQKIFCPYGSMFEACLKFKFLLHASSQKRKTTKKIGKTNVGENKDVSNQCS